jgi:hypothetical protein
LRGKNAFIDKETSMESKENEKIVATRNQRESHAIVESTSRNNVREKDLFMVH